jgi:hypothetical protein
VIIVMGLIILVAALVAGVAGVLGNGGSAHALTHPFAVLGYHVTGSAGTLFLCGIVVGAVGVAGLSLLLAGARRASRRGRAARRGLTQSRREMAAIAQDRDHLLDQRETAREYTAGRLGDDPSPGGRQPGPASGWQSRLDLFRHQPVFRHQPAARQAAAGDPGSLDGDAADVPADSRAPAQ